MKRTKIYMEKQINNGFVNTETSKGNKTLMVMEITTILYVLNKIAGFKSSIMAAITNNLNLTQ